MCSVLTSMATKENLVATEENTSDSTSERVDESEEVSVGSPEEPQGEDEVDCSPPPPADRVINGSTTTSALRVFRGRKRRSSADSTEEDGPLDFSSAKDGSSVDDNMPPKSYFLPFKKLEMTNSIEAASAMAMASVAAQHQKLLKPVAVAASTMQVEAANSAAKNKRKSGVAGFSIDDILSHKTAALKGQKDSQHQQQQQPIVRPWDIHVGSGGGTSGSPTHSAAAATAMAAALHRKQSKQTADDSGDSPLDALFQMASKTFEGLKAKTGKSFFFGIN